MTRTSGLDFGSDPAHQWDTKRELFHLAEVCALPSAVLLCAVLPSCHPMSDFSFGCLQDISKSCGRIWMKFENFRKCGSNWLVGLCRPFSLTKFYERLMQDCRRVGDINV